MKNPPPGIRPPIRHRQQIGQKSAMGARTSVHAPPAKPKVRHTGGHMGAHFSTYLSLTRTHKEWNAQ